MASTAKYWRATTGIAGDADRTQPADRPYFIRLWSPAEQLSGARAESNRVRYYLAELVRDGFSLFGVAVVRIEFDPLEAAWERAFERVLVTDSEGVAFLASDPAYRYRSMGPLAAPERNKGDLVDRYPGVQISPIDFVVRERRGTDSIIRVRAPDDDVDYLYQSMMLDKYGWTIHRLTDLTPVIEDRRDGAIIGGAISALVLALLLYLMQRHRAYVAAKEASSRLTREVAERTHELSETNISLKTEIDEHQRTEARLRTTQNELVQAGKLAALGQICRPCMKINQPLAAIAPSWRAPRCSRDMEISLRWSAISISSRIWPSAGAHHRTSEDLAQEQPGHPEPVLIDRAIEGTLFLLDSQIRAAGVRIEKAIEPDLW